MAKKATKAPVKKATKAAAKGKKLKDIPVVDPNKKP
jgi:hypothetical protein